MNFEIHWSISMLITGCLLISCNNKQESGLSNQKTTPPKPISQVVGIARIEPEAGLIDVYAGATGRIVTRPVVENQMLKKGQVMLTIDSETDNAQIAQSQAKISTQQAAVATQEASVATLKINADKAQTDYELNQKLFAVKGITQQTLHDSEVNAAKLRQDYQKGLADVRQTKAKIGEMTADVAYYRVQASQKTLHAPYAGRLLEWKINLGDYVTGNTAVAQMAPDGPLTARTEVDELFAERVKTGQKADIRSQATGKIVGHGVVYFTADFLKKKSLFADETSQEDRRVREVRIRLNPGADVLINGRVDCMIYLN